MKFPIDIFREILSYFHSTYKKPIHYVAILSQDDFYYLRIVNKKYSIISASYYIKVFTNTRINTTIPNIHRFRHSGVAKNNILSDFQKIIEEYKFVNPYKNQSNLYNYRINLCNINY